MDCQVSAGPEPVTVAPIELSAPPLDRRCFFQQMIASKIMTPCTLLPPEIDKTQRWIKILDDWHKGMTFGYARYVLWHPTLYEVTYHVVIVERNLRSDGAMLADGYILCNMKVEL